MLYSDNTHYHNPKREKELLLDADVCHEAFQKQYNDPDVSKFDNMAIFIRINKKVERYIEKNQHHCNVEI